MVLAGPGVQEFVGDRLPQIGGGPVVAEGPHAGALQVVAVDQVVLEPERGGVVVIELAPAVVVALAGVVCRRAPPGGPRRLGRGVPVVSQLLSATGEVAQDSRVGVSLRTTAWLGRTVGRVRGRRPLVAVVGDTED